MNNGGKRCVKCKCLINTSNAYNYIWMKLNKALDMIAVIILIDTKIDIGFIKEHHFLGHKRLMLESIICNSTNFILFIQMIA